MSLLLPALPPKAVRTLDVPVLAREGGSVQHLGQSPERGWGATRWEQEGREMQTLGQHLSHETTQTGRELSPEPG